MQNGRGTIDAEADLRLVRRIQSGDADALTALFQKYSGQVHKLARRILENSGEAEEVVQQVFIDTYKAIHQFDPQKASYKTWLFQFAYHRAINRRKHLESKAFYASVELDEEELMTRMYESAGKFVQQLSSEETTQLIKQLLRSIQASQRRVIALTFFHGLTAEQIAARTGESAAAVRHNLYRALARLRSALLDSTEERVSVRRRVRERPSGVTTSVPNEGPIDLLLRPEDVTQ